MIKTIKKIIKIKSKKKNRFKPKKVIYFKKKIKITINLKKLKMMTKTYNRTNKKKKFKNQKARSILLIKVYKIKMNNLKTRLKKNHL